MKLTFSRKIIKRNFLGNLLLIFTVSIFFISCSHKINPEKPSLAVSDFKLDSLPDSEINIPIQINLKPIYAMAESHVDTLFTSPGYPDGWVQSACDTRYKYSFRRGPLQMKASGTSLNLGFTGYYKIVGSTRVCVAGAAISPWTPPCRCGFDEGERRVNISFTNSISVLPDYKVKLNIRRNEPQAVDKCTVCFWGQNITVDVLNGLKAQLDSSKAEMDRNYGTVDLRPQFQQLWSQLNKLFNIYDMGWLQINPQRIRINNLYAKDDSLFVYMGLSARPAITLDKPKEANTIIPAMGPFSKMQGFSVFLDAQLDYDSLSNIVTRQMSGKEFDFNKGPVKKKVIIKDCRLYGANNEKLIIRVNFAGTDEGVFYLTGKPTYDKATHILEMKDIDFDINSKNALLKTAEWLFSRKIINEISHYTRFDLSSYIDTAKVSINEQLNHQWVKGVSSAGKIDDIKLIGIYPLGRYLVIRSNCSGNLSVKVESIDFSL
ncbi:MAG: DUF4403 family protein [Chitinophagaceae bacterium]